MLETSKKLSRITGQTNAKYNLIEDGDKVLVGFSGGKDSLTLIHTLKRMQKHAPFKFDFKAVTVTYGIGEQVEFLVKHCKKYDIKHEIINTQIFDISKDKIRKNSSFCSFVSRMRRGYLYTHAIDNGFNKLALGHHLDDAIESFFMNFFYNGSMRSMPPVYKAKNGLIVIRPLIFCRERQLRGFATDNNIAIIGDENCPAMRVDIKMPHARDEAKKLLAKLEAQNSQIFVSMKKAFMNFHPDTFFDIQNLYNIKTNTIGD
ncbi:tRNA(Cytosine32)-2-thiocytidine synthetase [hydrothermal vent metagenome]|uniref:tRNA(Cytosine32)-2-thiocytidine synthetase n=1 Tax=hydrothermal vent metagenome TaxID=652676 RepID=A0A3B1E942_9ZZZZ